MNNKFDELSKSLAQSVTRRAALKRFGVGLAGMVLACFGLANKAEAGNINCFQKCLNPCVKDCVATGGSKAVCRNTCDTYCSFLCNR